MNLTAKKSAAAVLRLCAWTALLMTGASVAVAAAGSTPATFSVSNSGAATYQIAIQTPPGVGAVVPNLSLQYNSQGSRGIAGPGWSLEGLPVIRRCPRTLAQDGIRGGIELNANDRFCLQSSRLVMPSADTHTYGADGATYFTEVDSFSRVTSRGAVGNGPEYFEVEDKSGLRLRFGGTFDSRLMPMAPVAGQATPTTVLTWYLSQVSDRSGNVLTISYSMSNGEITPAVISYAGGAVKVAFEYVADQNPRTMYVAGTKIQYTQLLSRVTTSLSATAAGQGETIVKQYRLGYEFSDLKGDLVENKPIGILTSVQECAGKEVGSDCLPALKFQWDRWTSIDRKIGVPTRIGNPSDPSLRFALNKNYGDLTIEGGLYSRKLADMNGDGHQDIVVFWKNGVYAYLSRADGTYPDNPTLVTNDFGVDTGWKENDRPYAGFAPRNLVDLNGDGYPDIVGVMNLSIGNIVAPGIYVAFWDPTSQKFGPIQQVQGASVMAGTKQYCNSTNYDDLGAPRYQLDMNGDGTPDMVRFTQNGIYFLNWNLNNGYGAVKQVSTEFRTAKDGWYGDSCASYLNYQPIFMEDMNGDGYPDVVGVSYDKTWIAIWNPVSQTFNTPVGYDSGIKSIALKNSTVRMADMNGDGYPDLVDLNSGGVWVALWTGTGFAPNMRWTTEMSGGSWDSEPDKRPRMLVDVNGDGAPDLVGFDTTGVVVALSDGNGGFAKAVNWSADYFNSKSTDKAGQSWIESKYTPRFLQDVDGDGTPDIVGFGDMAMVWSALPRWPGARISQITDSMAGITTLQYGLTQRFMSSVYENSALYASVLPLRDTPGPLQVVQNVTRSTGGNRAQSTAYRYSERRADIYRGDLGFRVIDATDTSTRVTTRRTLSQRYPTVGWVLNERQLLDGVALVDTTTFVAQDELDSAKEYPTNKRYFSYVSGISDVRKDKAGNSMGGKATSFVYGKTNGVQLGDLTSSTVTYAGELSVTTNMTYSADLTNWLIGLPTTNTETRTRLAASTTATTVIDAAPKEPGRTPISPAVLNVILSILLDD